MFNYQHHTSQNGTQSVDENAISNLPTCNMMATKANMNPIKLSKPNVLSLASTQQQTNQRTCLGDISNQVHNIQHQHHLHNASKFSLCKLLFGGTNFLGDF